MDYVCLKIYEHCNFIELSGVHGQGVVASPLYLPRNEVSWKNRRPVPSTWTTAVRRNLEAQEEKSVRVALRATRLQDTCESRRPKQ